MNLNQLINEYEERIGKANERVSFLHIDPAIEAAEKLAKAAPEYTGVAGHNFIWRIGQILGDAKYFAAVAHTAAGVYEFNPSKL